MNGRTLVRSWVGPVLLGVAVFIAVLAWPTGHTSPSAQPPVPASWPAYFHALQKGGDLESDGRLREAIAEYRAALSLVDGVDAAMRTQARIAAHNRLSACYRKVGDVPAARRELEASLGLGDTKYAPRSLRALGAPKAKESAPVTRESTGQR